MVLRMFRHYALCLSPPGRYLYSVEIWKWPNVSEGEKTKQTWVREVSTRLPAETPNTGGCFGYAMPLSNILARFSPLVNVGVLAKAPDTNPDEMPPMSSATATQGCTVSRGTNPFGTISGTLGAGKGTRLGTFLPTCTASQQQTRQHSMPREFLG